MKKTQDGQVIVIVAVLLLLGLFLLALIIDGSILIMERQHMKRAADAAGKAGMMVAADRMVTQVAAAQTVSASQTPSPTPDSPSATVGESPLPSPDDFYPWLSDDHRATLVSPPLQTMVVSHIYQHLERVNSDYLDPGYCELEVEYPYHYHPEQQQLQLSIQMRRNVSLIFGGLLGSNKGMIHVESRQSLPQRAP